MFVSVRLRGDSPWGVASLCFNENLVVTEGGDPKSMVRSNVKFFKVHPFQRSSLPGRGSPLRRSTPYVSMIIWLKQSEDFTGKVDSLCFNESLVETDEGDHPWGGRPSLFQRQLG